MSTSIPIEHLVELIRRASTVLPPEVEAALARAQDMEVEGSPAHRALAMILDNARLARESSSPLCQDTGTLLFYVDFPGGWSARSLVRQIGEATALATRQAILRPNSVDSITGQNPGDNLGRGMPSIQLTEWGEDYLRVRLLLKGGGSENVSTQYALPHQGLGAGRDLQGVRRVVLHAVHAAQGLGCAPGVLGVCIGGDRGGGYAEAKRQLLRPLDDANAHPRLADLEQRLLEEANSLQIGPMGFGGQTTLLGVKIGTLHRLPASYFVTISYMCWACRRCQMIYREGVVEYA